MAGDIPLARHHPECARLLAEAARGEGRRVYVFVGAPFETKAAAHALIDLLVPAAARSFNLEMYDGRSTPMATVLDSLRTPGFLAGRKVVWVRDSTVFIPAEQRSNVTSALLKAAEAGRDDDAAQHLLTLVAMAGWSQAQFAEIDWRRAPKKAITEVFGDALGADDLAPMQRVHAAAIERQLRVAAQQDDAAMLTQFLEQAEAAPATLILTTEQCDTRKRAVKRLRELGSLVEFTVARERSGALARDSIDELIARIVHGCDKRLTPAARELIGRRIGSDPSIAATELEKLCLYAWDEPVIDVPAVRALFPDLAESWIFDFVGALASRRLDRGLPLLRGLLGQGEPPLRLLAMIARELRLLLVARECLRNALQACWRAGMTFAAFQTRVLPQVDAATREVFGNAHPFVLFRRFQDAGGASARQLRAALIRLAELDIRLKSSRTDPALLLEAFVVDWCRSDSAGSPLG